MFYGEVEKQYHARARLLADNLRRRICQLHEAKLTPSRIAKETGASYKHVALILGQEYADFNLKVK
jgi:AraC-like DNA-binding protein